MKYYCYNCKKEINRSMKPWMVFIVDETGNEMTVPAYCGTCAESIQDKYSSIHENRMNKVKFQNFKSLFTNKPNR